MVGVITVRARVMVRGGADARDCDFWGRCPGDKCPTLAFADSPKVAGERRAGT